MAFLARSKTFSLDLDPLSRLRSLFRTWSTFDINLINSVLASPSIGGAAIWTPTASLDTSVIEFCLAPGFACIRNTISPLLFTLIASMAGFVSSTGFCVLLDFLLFPFFDDISALNTNERCKYRIVCIQISSASNEIKQISIFAYVFRYLFIKSAFVDLIGTNGWHWGEVRLSWLNLLFILVHQLL